MSFISNFDGTMRKSIQIGKKGVVLKSELGELNLMDTNENLIPVSAADPIKDSHLVTLKYFNEHNNGGTNPPENNNVIVKEMPPKPTEGKDNDVFYEVDDEFILNIYVKHDDKWKMFKHSPVVDEPNIRTVIVPSNSFSLVDGVYTASIPLSNLSDSVDLIIDAYDIEGEKVNLSYIITDSEVKINLNEPEIIMLKIIGANKMKTTYVKEFTKTDWATVQGESYSKLVITADEHNQGVNSVSSVYEGENSTFSSLTVNTSLAANGDISIFSTEKFDGKIVVYGN